MSIKKNIWFTEKSRINAENRYKHYNFIVNALIIAYSFALICLSIYKGYTEQANFPDFLQLILSVGVFTLSSITFGANYHGKAADFRECYLRLGVLGRSNDNEKDITNSYNEILQSYQNHSGDDYLKIIIDSKLLYKTELTRTNGEPITLSRLIYAKYFAKKFFYYLGILLAFMPPILIVLFIAADYVWATNGG